jgi:hypothetical protein
MNRLRRRLHTVTFCILGCACLTGCVDQTRASAPDVATAGALPPAPERGDPALASGRRLVLWDGAHIKPRSVGTGIGGRLDFWDGGNGWASCNSKPNCQAGLAAAKGAGVEGGKGLKLHAEGAGWIGGGWSWFAWYPATAGTDLTPYRNITFQIRTLRRWAVAQNRDPAGRFHEWAASRRVRSEDGVGVSGIDVERRAPRIQYLHRSDCGRKVASVRVLTSAASGSRFFTTRPGRVSGEGAGAPRKRSSIPGGPTFAVRPGWKCQLASSAPRNPADA